MGTRLLYANMPLEEFIYLLRVSFVIQTFIVFMSEKIIFRIIPTSSDKSFNSIAILYATATFFRNQSLIVFDHVKRSLFTV